MVRTQDAGRKNERTQKGPRPCMQSVPVVCRGPAREVSLTSRVAGRKEVRAEEASCHVPTMTTALWSWELRCWGPCLHGILRQPMGRADVHRTPGTDTDSVLSQCVRARLIGHGGARTSRQTEGEGCRPQGATKSGARSHHVHLEVHRLPGCGTCAPGPPAHGHQNKTSACGRLRAGPVSENEP